MHQNLIKRTKTWKIVGHKTVKKADSACCTILTMKPQSECVYFRVQTDSWSNGVNCGKHSFFVFLNKTENLGIRC